MANKIRIHKHEYEKSYDRDYYIGGWSKKDNFDETYEIIENDLSTTLSKAIASESMIENIVRSCKALMWTAYAAYGEHVYLSDDNNKWEVTVTRNKHNNDDNTEKYYYDVRIHLEKKKKGK